MLFYVGKIVQVLISPLCVSLGLLVVSILLYRRRPALGRGIAIAATLILWAASTNFVAIQLMRGLEGRFSIVPSEEMPTADAIVLLGGTVYPVEPPRVEPEELSGSRVLRATRLFRARKAPRVVCSGGGRYQPKPDVVRTEAGDMEEVLVAMGVPDSSILREERSRNTHENALYSAELLRGEDVRTILLVTSAFHLPRAVSLFEREGLTVIPAGCDVRGTGNPWQVSRFMPSMEALKLTSLAINEYVGLWGYWLIGKL